jgi:hypothetical protein
MRANLWITAGLLLASCASVPPEQRMLEARVEPDALRVIDNVLRHEGPPPPSPRLVRELLARPFAAMDAASLFERTVPHELMALAEPASNGPGVEVRELLDPYLASLAEAQRVLKSAQRGAPLDAAALLSELDKGLPSAARMHEAAKHDAAQIERATALFLQANARLSLALRGAQNSVRFPDAAQRFASAAGIVSIGTRGNDWHGADAAVIVDPGGNDTYERLPVTGGAISVIVDLGGDDRYRGSDVAIHGLGAILDFGGDDAYDSTGPGWGTAIAGASLLVDYAGNDTYASGYFGQGAAAFGLGALLDLAGNDGYRLGAGGQGFGLAGGLGLLWDHGGDDRYMAGGLRDAYDRGAGVSFAQGAATGVRTSLGGGIGILRDDEGRDDYAAEMFAQGTGYYYSLGLLWDRAGADHYHAARYAQGNGVHEAVGVLRDEAGNDRYGLSVGVGQGMGLDLAVGVLADLDGDDRYTAPNLAQGSATDNGVGLLLDSGGSNTWRLDVPNGWGRVDWSRGLPSLGLLQYDPAGASFRRQDKPVDAPRAEAKVVQATEPAGRCPAEVRSPAATGISLGQALARLGPGLVSGDVNGPLFRFAQEQLRHDVASALAELPPDDFNVAWPLHAVLRCALTGTDEETAARMWDGMERMLESPYAGAIAGALRARPAPAPQMQRMVERLAASPLCSVQVSALVLANTAGAAQRAMRSGCWRLQARALQLLDGLGIAPEDLSAVPGFLRQAFQASGKRSESSRTP